MSLSNIIKVLKPLLFIILFSTFVTPVLAQDAAGLTIIPPKFELFANPGDVVSETIKVRNDSDSPLVFGVLVEDFSSSGEEGGVVLEEGETDTTYSLQDWIEPGATNITLQPGEEQVFPFTINIPKDAEPGGHYASILFQLGNGETTPGVTSVQHRLGSLVLMRVSGNVNEEASVETFAAPVYSRSGPITFSLRVQNNGTTHVRPTGTIIVTNLFGQKVDEIPLNSANVFPGAIRKIDTKWSPGNLLGHYTATLVASYGQQSLPMTAATSFTVASPLSLIMLVVGSIAGLIFIISLITGRKRLQAAMKVLTSGS